ncbi:glycosyltransferase family 9 protein [Geobacter sp. OR-1]|uniref:glycosyltransferase family 9 protein n=1 Tax=Geobacter sp. OR-1 TaxID=1266765 RepID=UPI001ED9B533|nr:glycosyltransferase family 9 protein [Geobacter sp. OR-1]
MRFLAAPPAGTIPLGGPLSILLIRPGGIGDAVHLIPAINSIREKFPDAAIDLLAEKRNAAIFGLCREIRTTRRYDVPGELVAAMRSSYDVVIDSEQWHRLSAAVARLIGAPVLVGFATNERSRLFNYPVPYSQDDYEAASFYRLLQPFGIDTPADVVFPWLSVPAAAADKVAGLLSGLEANRFVAVFPGASIPERRWGMDRFRTLARRLSERSIPVVVIGGREDAAEGDGIVQGLPAISLAGKTSLLETAAVIDRGALLVSGDSGVLHIGVGLGKATVSLFGSGIAAKWAPRGDNHVVVNKGLSCSPCTRFGYTPTCLNRAKCIAEISPDEVYSAVISCLARKNSLIV